MYIFFPYRNGNKSKANAGLVTYVCCLMFQLQRQLCFFFFSACSFQLLSTLKDVTVTGELEVT